MRADVAARFERARSWLTSHGRAPFDFQYAAWRAYWNGESGLINAATGTGKTLAAWLGPLLESGWDASRGMRVIWVTPLRALARDLELSLREPLAYLGSSWRIERRTGDTPGSRRRRQRTHPPQALVTTPESLSVLLSHADMVAGFRQVDALIVDEWHEFLGNKRGVQLELAAARLRSLSPRLRVWGLSATVPDLDAAMQALLGPRRPGTLIRASDAKRYEVVAMRPPVITRFPWSGHLGLQSLPQVLELLDQGRSTLVFTNTRAQAELWYQAIVTTRLDLLTTTALHHGSIDAAIRSRVEDGLKTGHLRCVVCTSSLDLGVDFPPVDQVVQIGSPKGVARLLQRAGRSGHRPGQPSRVTLVPTHALELLECAAARHAAQRLELEPRQAITGALDVLAQHLVTLAAGAGFDAEQMLEEVRGTHAFQAMTDDEWRWVIDFITRGGSALQGYPQFQRVSLADGRHVMRSADLVRRHRQSIGTIASSATFTLKWLRGGSLGHVEESFIGRLRRGDVFIFGGRALELVSIKDSAVHVRLAAKSSRYVPRWQGARMPLSLTLGRELLAVLESVDTDCADPEVEVLRPLLELQARWSSLPTRRVVLAEVLENREGFHLFVFPFAGRRLNESMAGLVAFRAAREAPRTFSITSNEYGFELLCEDAFDVAEPELRRWLSPRQLLPDLEASVNVSDLARRQFRDIARIAGLVDAGTVRRGKTGRQLQVSSDLMFDVLQNHDPGNLLLAQARREALLAQLDHRQLAQALAAMTTQDFRVMRPGRLTPFTFPLWADRLQTQTLSTETWQARVERAARQLERSA